MTSTNDRQHSLNDIDRLALIGAGKMGSAMLGAWLSLGLDPRKLIAIEPQPSADVVALTKQGLILNPSLSAVREIPVIVLAVKPQIAPDVLPELAGLAREGTLVVSIMAGRTLAFLETGMPKAAIVRAMPNTPAAIGRGITVAVPNRRVTPEQRAVAHKLLAATGSVEWVADESLMDAVTAVSGSGPAYVFLLAEALAQAGAAAGLPAALAAKLARETVAGSGELLHISPLQPSELRKNVTSPGGTTAAALDILMGQEGLKELMARAVAAATRRSRELAG
jgi:pyrroline-5-carboxylate reductase